jgi:cell division protein FtsZ
VVTKPFHFEGKYRMETAETGIDELKKYVDTLIVIPNQNLFRIANENTTFESAFKMADDVLHAGVRGITDLITMPGLVNLDFADIRTIMTKMGKAMMGTGEATGENRAIAACEAAVSNPLLDDISIRGAKGVLVNMTGGPDMTLFEADMAVNAIKKEVDPNANIIFGSAFNENMKGKIRISVVATGIDEEEYKRDVFRSQENHEPSRFRINQGAASLENQSFTVKNQIEKEAIKTSNYSFFDPGVATKPENEDLEVVDANSDFKLKKSYFDEEKIIEKKSSEFEKPTFKTSDNIDKYEEKTNQKKSVSVSFFGNEIVNDDDSFEDSVEKQEVKKETKIAGESFSSEKTKLSKKEKKESQGFGLFSFMNSSKSKEEKISNEIEAKESVLQNFDSIETDKKTDELSQKADKKRREFFGSTIFDEENKDQNDKALDDDILNVPAFFRRKK